VFSPPTLPQQAEVAPADRRSLRPGMQREEN
jgi:hypothetical protein